MAYLNSEIERKFFVKHLPDLSNIAPIHYERYFLRRDGRVEERITKSGDRYTYEYKVGISRLERTRDKKVITKEEFEQLKLSASEVIERDRYDISDNPKISIQIYIGKFEGLIRAEVEFPSEEAAKAFVPLEWMGEEMTGLPVARDSELLGISSEGLQQYIGLKKDG